MSFDITYVGQRLTAVVFTAYNSDNLMVARERGPMSAPKNFTIQVRSPQYDITHFTVTAVGGIGTGYDNVSYTVLPEPAGAGVLAAVGLVVGGRRRGRTLNVQR